MFRRNTQQSALTATEETKTEPIELDVMNVKLQCSCPKDPKYMFACTQGVKWFMSNELLFKIRRRQLQNANIEIADVINEEFLIFKDHYNSLKRLTPKAETVLQIDRDLYRTFPKNKYF